MADPARRSILILVATQSIVSGGIAEHFDVYSIDNGLFEFGGSLIYIILIGRILEFRNHICQKNRQNPCAVK